MAELFRIGKLFCYELALGELEVLFQGVAVLVKIFRLIGKEYGKGGGGRAVVHPVFLETFVGDRVVELYFGNALVVSPGEVVDKVGDFHVGVLSVQPLL